MKLIVAAALAALGICAAHAQVATPIPKEANWSLRLPKLERVSYQGVAELDAAARSGNMMYPAPNLAGFLAAIATHALVESSVQARNRERVQSEADRVLERYRPVLDGYTSRALMERALRAIPSGGNRRLIGPEEAAGSDWVVDSASVFFMTRDERALIVETGVALRAPGATAAAYETIVKVVSRPRDGDDLHAVWSANDGEQLKEESAKLLGHAIDIALRDAGGAFGRVDAPHRTYRYPEGAIERMERASLVADLCDRRVVKTLRGWLLSIPPRAGESAGAAASNCVALR